MVVKATYPEYGIKLISTTHLINTIVEPQLFSFYVDNNLSYIKPDKDFKKISTHFILSLIHI